MLAGIYGRPAAATCAPERTLRGRSVLPDRAARARVRRGGAGGARPPRDRRGPAFRRVGRAVAVAVQAGAGRHHLHALARDRRDARARPRRAPGRARCVPSARRPRRRRVPRSPEDPRGQRHLGGRRRTGRTRAWPTCCRAADRPATWPACWSTPAASSCRPATPNPISLDEVPLPARHALATGHRHYSCLQFKPVWVVETARGCPYRCSFCSVWSLYHRTFRFRGDRRGLPRFRLGRPAHLRGRRLVLGRNRAQPRAGTRARPPRRAQGMDRGAGPHRPGGVPSRAAGGLAPVLQGLRHLLRPRGGHRQQPEHPGQGQHGRAGRSRRSRWPASSGTASPAIS